VIPKLGAQNWHRWRRLYADAHATAGNAADREDDVIVHEYLLADPTG
jgi:hypothetical protein